MTDYISREAAIEAVKKEREYTGKFSFEEEHAWAVGFHQGITFALSDISSIPAADVRPNVRGRWEYMECLVGRLLVNFPGCSECKATFMIPMESAKYSFNFCPNCGAKMTEEAGE